MILKRVLSVTLFLIIYLACVNSARILGFFPTPSKSHVIIHMSVVKGLVEKGHDVTVVTNIPLSDPNPKYRHILIEVPEMSREMIKSMTNNPPNIFQQFSQMSYFTTIIMENINISLNHPKMQKIMEEESFDLVLFGYFFIDFQVGVASHFKCPAIIIWMSEPTLALNYMIGATEEPSYVPQAFLGLKQPMGFIDRIKNFLFWIFENIMFWLITMKMEPYYKSNFPPSNYPSLDEARKNVSLLLVNHHFSQGPIRPYLPALVDIGGIQIKSKPDPLPQDLQKALDSAKNGAIYFSLGSNVRSSELNSNVIKTIYNVLSKLKQTVIWKWESDEVPGNAGNIVFKKWLPQDDILAHPNVKLFISHVGQGSLMESLYHGVPIIGFPMFADQFKNINTVKSSNFGLGLDHKTLTEEIFAKAIKEVLENPKYKNAVKEFSELYRDRPETASETATFWVEYVIRHKGAPHLQSPSVHMNYFQLQNLDVIGFLIIVIYLSLKIFVFVIKFIFRKIFKRNSKKPTKDKKKTD